MGLGTRRTSKMKVDCDDADEDMGRTLIKESLPPLVPSCCPSQSMAMVWKAASIDRADCTAVSLSHNVKSKAAFAMVLGWGYETSARYKYVDLLTFKSSTILQLESSKMSHDLGFSADS